MVVVVVFFARVNTGGTIIAANTTLATKILIKILYSVIFAPPYLNNEY